MTEPEGFEAFVRLLGDRLEQGAREYGDRSFAAEPAVLVAELQAEALDLAGWGFVLFRRLERMRAALATLHDRRVHGGSGVQAEPAMVAGARLVPAERGTRPTPEQPAPESFAVAFSPDELVILGALAVKLGMPPGDVLRFAVRRLWTEAGRQSKTSPPAPAGRLVGAERGSE
ncbi:MAG TPA: hypothetical protein VF989_16805 [Polyangiaceae bacterium]